MDQRPNVIRQFPPGEFVGMWRLERFALRLRETLLPGDIVQVEEKGQRAGDHPRLMVCEVILTPIPSPSVPDREGDSGGPRLTWVAVKRREEMKARG